MSAPDAPAGERAPRSLRRSFAAMVLVGEVLVVGFAALVAKDLSDVSGRTVAVAAGVTAVLAVLAAGLLRSRLGYLLGWLVQAVLVVSGVWVPMMFFVGIVFAVVWGFVLVAGGRADAVTAQRLAATRGGGGPVDHVQ